MLYCMLIRSFHRTNNNVHDLEWYDDDEIDIERLKTASNYRVVPFQSSLDTIEIHKLIKDIS